MKIFKYKINFICHFVKLLHELTLGVYLRTAENKEFGFDIRCSVFYEPHITFCRIHSTDTQVIITFDTFASKSYRQPWGGLTWHTRQIDVYDIGEPMVTCG